MYIHKIWNQSNLTTPIMREREREREREGEREGERQRERDRETERDRDRDRSGYYIYRIKEKWKRFLRTFGKS